MLTAAQARHEVHQRCLRATQANNRPLWGRIRTAIEQSIEAKTYEAAVEVSEESNRDVSVCCYALKGVGYTVDLDKGRMLIEW